MTVKMICAVAIIVSCSYVGIGLTNNMKKRVRSLTAVSAAVGHIESCIRSVKMPLAEIYSGLAERSGVVGEFFSKIIPGEKWDNHLEIFAGLTLRDKTVISSLSQKLGATDSESQLEEIGLAKKILEEELGKAKKDVADNSRVYKSMSFFAGVIIAVLLI